MTSLAWMTLLATMALAGCIQTGTPLLDSSGIPSRPIATGYWQVCTPVKDRAPDCSVTQVENFGDSRGVFWSNGQNPPEAFVTRGIKGDFFVFQAVVGATSAHRRYVYLLGRPQADGRVTLSLPSCDFPPTLLARLRGAGVGVQMLAGDAGCRPRPADVASLLRFFDVLADNPDWTSSVQTTLRPLGAAEGRMALEAETRKAAAGATE